MKILELLSLRKETLKDVGELYDPITPLIEKATPKQQSLAQRSNTPHSVLGSTDKFSPAHQVLQIPLFLSG